MELVSTTGLFNTTTNDNQSIQLERVDELPLTTTSTKRNEKQISQLISQIPDVQKYFNIHRKIGQGTFSSVFQASLRCHHHVPANSREYFAIKHLIPTVHPNRVERELRCLQQIGGSDNIIGIDLCLRNYESVAFVMPFVAYDRFQDFYESLSPTETRNYIKNLLVALKRVHSFNIIHRDVKPSNFLYDRKKSRFVLVDFGLAQEVNLNRLNRCMGTAATTTAAVAATAAKGSALKNEVMVEVVGSTGGNEEGGESKNNNGQVAIKRKREDNDEDDMEVVCVTKGGDLRKVGENGNRTGGMGGVGVGDGGDDNDEIDSSQINKNIIPSVKRARYANNNVPNTKLDNLENSQTKNVQLQSPQQLLVASPFKTPLKQFNKIVTVASKHTVIPSSTIETTIKTAVLGLNLNDLMMQRGGIGGGGGIVGASDTNHPTVTQPPSGSQNQPSNGGSQLRYNTDNRKISKGVTSSCFCYGRNMVCNICVVKKEIVASRAGTSGYRPPEVLLKSNEQDTGVDIWSAGVIFISILARCYPFFNATDDFTALAEFVTVFGDDKIKKTALLLNRQLNVGAKKEPLHLRKLCLRLRNRCNKKTEQNKSETMMDQQQKQEHKQQQPPQKPSYNKINSSFCKNCDQIPNECLCANSSLNNDFSKDEYSELAYDLLSKLLEINPRNRITAADALEHPYFKESL